MYYLQTIASALATTALTWNHINIGWNNSVHTAHSAAPTASGGPLGPQIVEIVVGAARKLSFNPESVTVFSGTVLRFNFLGRNHTLTQSSLEHPCSNASLFDTGFNQFNPNNISGHFVVDYLVNTSSPEWFYCAQESPRSHCEAGMVFSLNPGDQYNEFAENAKRPPPLITAAPGLTYCNVEISAAANNSLSFVGTGSWNASTTQGTAITPEISNAGHKPIITLLHIFGALVFTLNSWNLVFEM